MPNYEQTHPWISFKFDLKRLSYKTWLLLGEALSKCDHIANVPVTPDRAQVLSSIYIVKGALATTAIEGNTLAETVTSDDELLALAQGRAKIPESQEYQEVEVQNIITAANWMLEQFRTHTPPHLNTETIKQFNRFVLENTVDADEEGVVPGEFRTDARVVGNVYGCPPAQDCKYLTSRFCQWMDSEPLPTKHELRIPYALVRAVLAHLYIAWIHPFGNGNGRTARLVEHLLLLEAGVPALSAQLLSNYYNRTRSLYYRQLAAASRGNDPTAFIEYAVRGFVEEINMQIQVIHEQHYSLAWAAYVDEKLAAVPHVSHSLRARRKKVLTALEDGQPVEITGIRRLTPELAEAYAQADDRRITRDLNALVDLKLLVREGTTVRAMREQLSSFLPERQETQE